MRQKITSRQTAAAFLRIYIAYIFATPTFTITETMPAEEKSAFLFFFFLFLTRRFILFDDIFPLIGDSKKKTILFVDFEKLEARNSRHSSFRSRWSRDEFTLSIARGNSKILRRLAKLVLFPLRFSLEIARVRRHGARSSLKSCFQYYRNSRIHCSTYVLHCF